jgi:hypothetical protein
VTLNAPTFDPGTNRFFTPFPAAAGISTQVNATGGLQRVETTANSNYRSFQMTLARRFTNNTQINGAYTYGKSKDCYSGGTVNELVAVAGAPNNCRYNYGRSDFNREHRLVVSGVYDLPDAVGSDSAAKWLLNDWQIAGIAVFQSGLPYSIVYTPGNNINYRANFAAGFSGDPDGSGSPSERLARYFNTTAFAPSCPQATNGVCSTSINTALPANSPFFDPNFPYGNTPRNFLTGPGQKNVDLSVIKFLPFTEDVKGELRVEFFNLFNWVNYANPVSNIALGNFGQVTSASTGPRVIQLGFKLNF